MNKKRGKNNKMYLKLLLFIVIIHVGIVLINQQKTLNEYNSSKEDINNQIKEANIYSEELNSKQNQVGSLEFIEKTAREKLDMYYPYETVYVDIGK